MIVLKVLFFPFNLVIFLIGFILGLFYVLVDKFEHWLDYDLALDTISEEIMCFALKGIIHKSKRIEFLTKHKLESWSTISKGKLTREEIYKYQDDLKWDNICRYQKLSPRELIAFSDKLHWTNIANYQELTEEFIFTHKDKLPIDKLRKNQYLMDKESPALMLWLELN